MNCDITVAPGLTISMWEEMSTMSIIVEMRSQSSLQAYRKQINHPMISNDEWLRHLKYAVDEVMHHFQDEIRDYKHTKVEKVEVGFTSAAPPPAKTAAWEEAWKMMEQKTKRQNFKKEAQSIYDYCKKMGLIE